MIPETFESIMLICFGCAWPLSIWKTWKHRSGKGKSLSFLVIILLGYAAGILFQVTGHLNAVIALYILNAAMVSIDLVLTCKYRHA